MPITRPLTRSLTRSLTRALTDAGGGGGGVPAFDPISRFSGGQQGIVVDLNDLSKLWKDTARTDPITAAGQTVKGITDKSGRGNHLSNATGWVLGLDGTNYYLQADGATYFESAAVAWGSDKASIFFGAKKDSGTGAGLFTFGNVSTTTGTFEHGYYINGVLTYRRGSGAFGARATVTVGNGVIVSSTMIDLAGTTPATEVPYLRAMLTDLALTNTGATDSGGGNFGTQTIRIGTGAGGLFTGRVYSFWAVADDSTLTEMQEGEGWAASRSITPGVSFVAPDPVYLDTGAVTRVVFTPLEYNRVSAFSHADYQTTATEMNVLGYSGLYATFPAESGLAVFVNGVYNQNIMPTANGYFNTKITLPAGDKSVSFRTSISSSAQTFNTFETSFQRAVANAPMTVINTAPTNRVGIYGDSISVGGNATFPSTEAWAMLLRDAYAPNSVAMEGFGFRSLYMDAVDGTARAAFIAKIVALAPARLYMAIGTNDYGLNKWSAASFGAAYAAVLDDLHTALPSLLIFCQTPILRSSEAANGSGSTLGDYRTQIATAVSTRTSYATLVDGTTFMTTASLGDGVHPTTAGHVLHFAGVRAPLGI